jgi:inorganic triphosphatase YgiF
MGSPDDSGHSRSLEVELKFDVDDDTLLPDLSGLPGVAAIGQAELRELDAQYFDSADLALAHAGYALRRRSGGPDAGWHVKGPKVDGARLELHWPLSDDMPEAVLTAAREVTDAELAPLARIRNRRIAHNLYSADGGVVAEFLDDHVIATDERSGTERTWREWEFELGPAAPDDDADRQTLFRRFEKAVHAAGGRAAASDSKLARALGQ